LLVSAFLEPRGILKDLGADVKNQAMKLDILFAQLDFELTKLDFEFTKLDFDLTQFGVEFTKFGGTSRVLSFAVVVLRFEF
jgi:hypothetical protein